MKIEPRERLIIGIVYCGQNLKTDMLLELVPEEDDLEIGGVKYGEYKTALFRLESNQKVFSYGRKELLSISSVMCDGNGGKLQQIPLVSHYLVKPDTIGRNFRRGGQNRFGWP